MKELNELRRITAGVALALFLAALPFNARSQSAVTIQELDEAIPTYAAGPPDPNPMFFFGKQSQGAEGRIYPYPLYDNLTNVKGSRTYKMVYLENEYLKIGIMPEIGGRIFSAVDKTNNYDFIYRQHVVKPALIGLIGAWISGGLEWNIPHHHRASTFIPVQWSREDHADGSKTVWIGELEVRHRMRWAVGYTLRPGSSVLECSLRIVNRTPVVNTMLCFANIAVHTNENYQVIFPPRTQWSTGHSKRSYNTWPVVNGTDVSWYKNNRSSASWFAVNYEDDFVAGYDYGKNAGIMSVADHNIVPGKKFFTWGVGSMWDQILTDDDGPYLEIMVGAYSDNQPDYSWMQPFEERSFSVNIYPFRGISGTKNANLDAAVNLEVKDGKALFGFYTTRAFNNATAILKSRSGNLVAENISINPGKPYFKEISLPAGVSEHDLVASLTAEGRELISYTPVLLQQGERPVGTTTPGQPSSFTNDEELYLAGQRVWQFHNPSLDPDPFWEEALKRDSGNVAANTGMGILCLKDAKYSEAERYLRRAVKRLTAQYTTTKNAEPFYYLGAALKGQGRLDEAYTEFFKAAWSQEWKSPAYYSLAEIALIKGNPVHALSLVDQSLDANSLNVRAYSLKSAILRQLGRTDEALKVIAYAREKTDPLDIRLMTEQWLLTKDPKLARTLFGTMVDHTATGQETAAEYFNSGLWNDGLTVLQQCVSFAPDRKTISPIIYYYMGYFAEKLGQTAKSEEYRKQAVLQPTDYVFPFQEELIEVLGSAMKANPSDARAPYYMGNLLYDWQPEEATKYWERASVLDPTFPITWRNLAVAYSHQSGDDSKSKAITCLEKAVATGKVYPTHLIELDRLYQSSNYTADKRLAMLEKYQSVVVKNDEALGNLITLKNFAGKPEESIKLLQNRIFSIWEGGTAFNSGQAWADANIIQGIQQIKKKKFNEAIISLEAAMEPPDNLRAEQRFDSRNAMRYFWIGNAYEALGNKEKAKEAWNEIINPTARNLREGVAGGGTAAGGGMGPGAPAVSQGAGARRTGTTTSPLMQGEQKYFETVARMKLGNKEGTREAFNEIIASAENALKQPAGNDNEMPQFARRTQTRPNTAVAHYIAGLGYSGLGDKKKAREEFTAALLISPDYLNAKIALDQL
ncbi:MAG: DUF5107 domain-containing protein [Bacteroidales bacterium]|jgi:tetratricopeptide (TPR) repeat protein|nr:DUF5107 domain-containing protein [Bacteroidales bacterium]